MACSLEAGKTACIRNREGNGSLLTWICGMSLGAMTLGALFKQ
jgi:hypothetical protein